VVGQKSEILFLLLGQLSVGGIVLLAAISREQLGLSFFKLNGLIFFFLMGIAIVGVPVPDHLAAPSFSAKFLIAWFASWPGLTITFALGYSVCLFAYVVTFWIKKDTHAVRWLYAAALIGVAMILTSALSYAARIASPAMAPLIPLNFLLSALVLGSALLGMLLGHRYLTNPHLPMHHLNRLSWTFLIAIGLQGAMTVVNLVVWSDGPSVAAALRLETFLGLFFWIRLVIGIVVPLVLAAMILNSIRYRANMSATGLLYIAVIMVMAGEAFSRYLLLTNAILL
jgi:hypothetical protein